MTPKQFCDKHNSCAAGREWALATRCRTMRGLWRRKDLRPDWRVWIATRPGVMSKTDARLFACWCARHVWHLLTDKRSRRAVEVAEAYARGEAGEEELSAARDAARDAASATASYAASATASYAASCAASATAWDAASATASYAASAAARDAARDAASDADRDAAWDAAWDAAIDAQASRLIEIEVNL